MSARLIASDRAPGLHIEPGVEIPDDTQLAPHVTIYAGVELGADVAIEQGAILGRAPQLERRSRSPTRPPGEATIVGDGCRVGSGAVVLAGARLGPGAYLGDLAVVREGAVIGSEAMVGRDCAIGHHTEIGDRVRLQNSSIVGPWTRLEEDVFLGARVLFVGDPTMGRGPVDVRARETVVRRAARIGSGAIIIPPCEIGVEALVGAGSLVRGDVPPRTVVAGSPAAPIREVRAHELLDGGG